MKRMITWAACLLLAGGLAFAQSEDAEGCKDHPVVTRMPQFHLSACEQKEFDAVEFQLGKNPEDGETIKKSIEGKKTYLYYVINEGSTVPSPLQIFRNYQNAFKKLGAKIYEVWETGSSYNYLTAVISKNNREIWVMMEPSDGEYHIYIVEAEAMVQQVTASDMLGALNRDGFIALYINFDSGKAVVKEDSLGIIDQIHQLLKDNPALKISVEGHTDNTGTPAGNKKLSEERALAVAGILKTKGIAAGRLSTAGWGQERPVADNRTEDGKAKNRRVEIVKK